MSIEIVDLDEKQKQIIGDLKMKTVEGHDVIDIYPIVEEDKKVKAFLREKISTYGIYDVSLETLETFIKGYFLVEQGYWAVEINREKWLEFICDNVEGAYLCSETNDVIRFMNI